MPVFEFKCKDCGRVFETLVRSTDEETSCPACGSKSLARLLSRFSARSGSQAIGGGSCSSCSSGSCSSCR
ncbi:MAG: FmdB family zinc ribbon protein [Anaerolineae bacterium]